MTHVQMFGSARWIAADGITRTPCFRASFDAPAPRAAVITICGLGYFTLYLNGQRVGSDLFVPATSDYAPRQIEFDEEMLHRCYCLRYDVAPFMRAGRNELAVELGPGFFAEPTYSFERAVNYGEVRLCYRLEIQTSDGRVVSIASGPDARWAQNTVTRCDFFHGEQHDLRALPPDWTTASAVHWQPVRLLPPLDTRYQLQECPADRVIRRLTPRLLGEKGGARLYDAGENISGWVVLADESAAGETVSVCFSEALDENGQLDEHFRHWQYFDVVSDGRGQTLHPRFTWHAFRYFSVTGRARVVSVDVIHAAIAVTGRFSCADDTLNWLHDAFVRTQLNNLHGGIPSDCPHLERRGYTGDGQLVAETAALCLDYRALLRKWIDEIADCQDVHSGHVQYTAPYTRCGGGPGGWGCAIITVPLTYYRQYGDREPLRALYPQMRRYIGYLLAHSENGLVTSDRPGEWCLGDWCAPGGTKLPPPFVNTYFLIRSLKQLQEIEEILSLPVQTRWEEIAQTARSALLRDYFCPETGSFCDGMEGADAFALDIGLGDARTLSRLKARYSALGGYDTGIFGTEIVTRVLFERGEALLAHRLLTSRNPVSFYGWRQQGATTLWELWPNDPQRSLDHPMFGAAVKELFYRVLGLCQAPGSAGWRKVLIAPALTDVIPEAEGEIVTPLGPLALRYQASDRAVAFSVRIPAGMDARMAWKGHTLPLAPGESGFILSF